MTIHPETVTLGGKTVIVCYLKTGKDFDMEWLLKGSLLIKENKTKWINMHTFAKVSILSCILSCFLNNRNHELAKVSIYFSEHVIIGEEADQSTINVSLTLVYLLHSNRN